MVCKENNKFAQFTYFKHLFSLISGNSLICKKCCEFFPDEDALKTHMKANHTVVIMLKHFKCAMCSFSSSSKVDCQRHMMKHLTCKQCKQTFKNEELLREHTKSKHPERQHKCHICSFSSNRKIHFERHMKSHKLNLKLSEKTFLYSPRSRKLKASSSTVHKR